MLSYVLKNIMLNYYINLNMLSIMKCNLHMLIYKLECIMLNYKAILANLFSYIHTNIVPLLNTNTIILCFSSIMPDKSSDKVILNLK